MTELAAVIVETRPLVNLIEIIENHMKFLPKYTKLYVFGSKSVDLLLSQYDREFEFKPIKDTFTISEYNSLLTNPYFWDKINQENILIFQHDSEILREGIEDFYEWDYAGAPWTFQEHGGNGGLSFRHKSAMLKCIEIQKYQSYMPNEDVYFCNIMNLNQDIFNLAPRYINSKFSMEVIPEYGTFGAHAIDKYHNEDFCKLIRNQYI